MTTMVERMARGVWQRERDALAHDEPFKLSWYKNDMLATLAAMREPSERVISAGSSAMRGGGLFVGDGRLVLVWQAMIDQAIKEAEA